MAARAYREGARVIAAPGDASLARVVSSVPVKQRELHTTRSPAAYSQ